jgi:hypothetical protein
MLPTGLPTDPEFSPTVDHPLTTPSSWSELMLAEPGRSRTPGEPDGERVDSSDSQLETPVVSAPILVLLPPFDLAHPDHHPSFYYEYTTMVLFLFFNNKTKVFKTSPYKQMWTN